MQKVARKRIHKKIRKHLWGTTKCPRLSVFRSTKRIYAQIIDDSLGKTLVSATDMKETGTKQEKAYKVGKSLAEKALKSKITTVVFDRGGFLYQGRIEQLAKGAREGGLKF
ncbi:50S ribosomal protein L18 [Candidatus Daviesbacteria bacterium RIFCSPHIGHO2_02_FULL_36_13]|uniref:Large ribosomal subunit protein uL18 n=1 Tax=Candidatus Daviesbacteria bacterium RIFCSPHIGHO2_02_FULL_36_13 TaxID=1797768 RepID=A0A1F5JZ66_9BACT|nr:MAG: 50S ribosomal protein L18 [Candidatus Daviesbacteria bacterium RIFCSPHIGHO2_02_FULL_36_13]